MTSGCETLFCMLCTQDSLPQVFQSYAGSASTGDDYSEEAEASEPSEGASRRGTGGRAWPHALGEHGGFGMADLRAKAESLKASAQMAQLRASANKTGKQCVPPFPPRVSDCVFCDCAMSYGLAGAAYKTQERQGVCPIAEL